MIWKTIHIAEEARQGQNFIRRQIRRQMYLETEKDSFFDIGIVGAGPKGLYALEELLNCIESEKSEDGWNVFWWNDTEDFGCGPNYQVDQPDYLLINYCIGHVDAWDRRRGNEKSRLNLVDWIQKFKKVKEMVQPTDYASRALVGQYLQYVTMQVIASKPDNVRIHLIAKKVQNISLNSEKKLIVQTEANEVQIDNLLLATGHCYNNIPLFGLKNKSIPVNYLTNAYPIEKLSQIQVGKSVGIIGWGLTFIDVALQLTEGRGGRFDEEQNYIPGGEEPVLYPFSRNQLPIMPRGPVYGQNTYTLYYLNEKWLAKMQTLQKQRKIDFSTEIFPWLEKELQFAYYSTLLQTLDVVEVENYIVSLSETERFTYRDLLFPKIPQKDNLQKSYEDYLEFLISEAEKGELKSPLMAAAAVWREASPFIAGIYQNGGFTGESQQYLDKGLFGAFCRTSYGPPIENMKKIKALIKAGIIQTCWETEVRIINDDLENRFVLQSKEFKQIVDYIVDARIARPNLSGNNADLYRNLWKNSLVEPFENEGYRPGCVKINAIGQVLHSEKEIPLYLYGSNTEGFLLDNDSLSRSKNNLAKHWVNEVLHQLKKII